MVIHGDRSGAYEPTVYSPSVCVVLQGAKRTTAGPRVGEARAGDLVVVSHHVPLSVRFVDATPEHPYIALVLDVDLALLRELSGQIEADPVQGATPIAMEVGPADPGILAAFERMFALLGDPQDERLLGPLVLREIHYRILRAPQGRMLRELLRGGSHAGRIARAVAHIRRRFRRPLEVSEMARVARMSPSTFHEHFKTVTGTTPLQYQKDLRLFEAQRRLRGGAHSVTDAAFDVGYGSISQFSREYRRKFGRSPRQDQPA